MRVRTIAVGSVAMLAIQVAVAGTVGDRISTRQTGIDSFEITFQSQTVFDVEDAIPRIAPTAKAICGDRYIEPGQYTFDSEQAATASNAGDWFRLVQSIRCVDTTPDQPQSTRAPQLLSAEAVDAVRQKVRQLSEEYLKSLYANLGDDANAALAAMAGGDATNSHAISETAAHTEIKINLFRLTVYDNLPSAPANGVYVAVDYDNRVGNVAHHCGYLMWHSFDAKEFDLGRIESGTLDDGVLASMSKEDITAVRKRLRCSNFYDE